MELGANDGLRGIPIATIEENLSQILARARARGITVLLCGMETPPLNGWDYTLNYHRLFPRLAVRHDVALVPFLLEGVALNPELNGADGIHPNAAGARRIADTVWTYLAPLVASIGRGFQSTRESSRSLCPYQRRASATSKSRLSAPSARRRRNSRPILTDGAIAGADCLENQRKQD